MYDWPSDKEDIMHFGCFGLPASKSSELLLFYYYIKQSWFIKYSLGLLLHLLTKRREPLITRSRTRRVAVRRVSLRTPQ